MQKSPSCGGRAEFMSSVPSLCHGTKALSIGVSKSGVLEPGACHHASCGARPGQTWTVVLRRASESAEFFSLPRRAVHGVERVAEGVRRNMDLSLKRAVNGGDRDQHERDQEADFEYLHNVELEIF